MMSEYENMDIQINLKGDATDAISSANDTLLSLAQVSNEVESLKTKLTDMREMLKQSNHSLFDKDMMRQVDLAQQTVDKLIGMRQKIDQSLGGNDKESNTAFFKYAMDHTQSRINELHESTKQMADLKDTLSKSASGMSDAATNKIYNELRIGVKKFAESQSKAAGTRELASYVNGFMRTQEFKNIRTNNKSASALNESQLKTMLTAAATAAIGTIYRSEFTDWANERRSINKVQDLLPKAFANIKLGRDVKPTRDSSSADFSQRLSNQELDRLEKIIMGNQYVAREAQAAGLIRKHNGNVFMNKRASQGHVNDFAGRIAHLFSLGAVGLPMYGIDDIYDPKHFSSIASKTNKTISTARGVADMLSEQFKWLDPAYYSSSPSIPKRSSDWYNAGKVRAAGRKDRMQFIEVTPQEIQADGSIVFANGQPTYTPVVQSEYQMHLSRQKGATPFTHNGMNDNEIFVKLPNDAFVNAVANKDTATQEALQKEVARVLGTQIVHNGKAYSFSGLTKTHAAYTAVDLKNEILKSDPYFFNNGETQTTFTAANSGDMSPYERFAKAVEYNRLQRVEGEDITELYGVDTKNLKVVVGNLRGLAAKGAKRIDGQNIVSDRILSEGFQGRDYKGKATYSPYNIAALFKEYANHVDANGNLVLPGANINGGDLIIPPDVDIIEDFGNIKTNKAEYEALLASGQLSSEMVSADRQKDIAKYGLWAKTSYDAANTNARFMSAQLANTLAFTPEAQRYFQNIYFKELASLNDDVLVIDKLFNGNDLLSQDVRKDPTLLNTRDAQRRIQSYRTSLNEHMAKGDLLLPEGEAMYNMISAWVPDVINDILVAGGKELTDSQKAISLKYNSDGKTPEQLATEIRDQVLHFGNNSELVGLGRYPATINGNVETVNKAVDDEFQRIATALNVDKNALYVDPSSAILTRLQGADEDGDTALVYAIKHSKNELFSSMMKATLVNTANRYKKIYEKANLTKEDLDKIEASRTESIDPGKDSYSIDNPEDLAFFWSAGQKTILNMGSASGVTRNAFLRPISELTSKAMLIAERNYDINTVAGKKAKVFKTTNEEMSVLGEGAPVGSLTNWAMKSRTLDADDNMVGFDYKAFDNNYAEKVAKSNFASIHSNNDMEHTFAVWYAKNILGEDVSGGFKWDEIFENLSSPFASGSSADGLNRRLNDLRKRYIQGDFLVFTDDMMDELDLRAGDATREIINQVNEDSNFTNDKERKAEIARRMKLAGVDTVRHLREYGLTERNLRTGATQYANIEQAVYDDDSISEDMKDVEISRRVAQAGGHAAAYDMVRGVSALLGESGLYGNAVEYESTFSAKKQEENDKLLKDAQERKAKFEEEKAQKIKEYQDLLDEVQKDQIEQLEIEIERLKRKQDESVKDGQLDADLEKAIQDKEAELNALRNPDQATLAVYDENIAKAEADIKRAEKYQKDAYEYYRDQGEYQRIVGSAEEFAANLRRSERSKESYLADLDPATRYFNKQKGIADYHKVQLGTLAKNANLSDLQLENIQKLIGSMDAKVLSDFMDKGVSDSKHLAVDLAERVKTTSLDYDKYEQELDSYIEKLQEAESYQTKFLELAAEAEKKGDSVTADQFKESARLAKEWTDAGYADVDKLRTNLFMRDAENDKRATSQIDKYTRDRMRRYDESEFGRQLLTNENDYEWYKTQSESISKQISKWQTRASELEKRGQIDTDGYKIAREEIERLTGTLANCQKEMDGLSGVSGKANAALIVIGQTASRAITQFGRSMFNKAIQEAKNFVVSFDSAMTEIQMVTLKTDEEIEVLGDSLINKAAELRAGVGEITSAATSLYRQGLSDADVDARLEDVIKFSKTAKVSATDAIKLATVAMNSGNVQSSERVFDVVSALGDNAATEAAQITKGLQKSLSAAETVGVTFEELVAMLTVVTSKTQLSGSVAGTTMRNVMSRMTRFGDQDSRYAGQVQLLKNSGIEIFDGGEMRSVTKILTEIGKKWEEFDDRTKADIAYALGGTEQFSNVTALMQGFSEVDEITGQNLMEKYIQMAEQSNGITDKKYQHQVESLDGSLSNLTTTFDQLVESVEGTGLITDFLDWLSNGVAGFAAMNTETDGLISRLTTITAIMVAIKGLSVTNPYLLAMLAIGAGAISIGNSFKRSNERNRTKTISEQRVVSTQAFGGIKDDIKQASDINQKRIKGETISDNERESLVRTLTSLNTSGQLSFDGLTDSAGNAITSIDQLASSASATALALSGAADNIDAEQKRRNYHLSLSAANEVDNNKAAYETSQYDAQHSGLRQYAQTYEAEDGKQFGKIYAVQTSLDLVKDGKYPLLTKEAYSFAEELAAMGALDGATLANGDKFTSLLKNGTYSNKDIRNAVEDLLLTDDPFMSGGLLDVLSKYANDINSFAPFLSAKQGYGDYNSDLIFQSIVGRDDVSTAGYGNLLHKTLVEDVNQQYLADSDFDFSNYIDSIFAAGYKSYLQRMSPEEYAKITPLTEDEKLAVDAVSQFSNAVNAAKMSRSDTDYEDAWISATDIMRTSTGTASERFQSFASQITAGTGSLADWDEMIRDKGSEALVDAWASLIEKGENGQYQLRSNITDEEANAFERLLAGMSPRTSLMGQHRGAATVAASAQNTFDRLTAEGADTYKEWQNLFGIDELNQLAQNELIQVLGEDLVYQLINGMLGADGIAYAQQKLDAYSAESRVGPGYYSEDVKAIVQGITGSFADQMKQYGALQTEQSSYEKALYSYNRISQGRAIDTDYAQLADVIGLDVANVQELARTQQGQQQIETLLAEKIKIYSNTLSQALLAILPEDAISDLQADMDVDGLLAVFKENVSDETYALIETVLKSFGITYNGEAFGVNINADSGLPTAWQSIKDTESAYYEANRQDELLSYLKTAVVNGGNMVQYLADNASDEDWGSFFKDNPFIASAFRSYGENEGILDQEQMLTIINDALFGGSKSNDYYDIAASSILGDGYQAGGLDWTSVLESYASMRDTDIGTSLIGSLEDIEEGADLIELLNDALKNGSIDATQAEKALKNYNDAMGTRAVSQMNKYKKNVAELEKIHSGIAAGGKDAAEVILDINESVRDLNNIQWAVDKFAGGDRSSKVLDEIAGRFNVDKNDLKGATGNYAQQLVDAFNMSIDDEMAQCEDEMAAATNAMFDRTISNMALMGQDIDLGTFINVDGSVNISGLLNAMAGSSNVFAQQFITFIRSLSDYGATLTATATDTGNGISLGWDTSGIKGGTYRGSSSRGGGSKKSSADKLVERIGHGRDLYEHQIQMVQYEQTKYENADELGNYGKMLEEEIRIEEAYLPVLEANIAALKSELSTVSKGSEDWYKLRDAILEAEEQYSDINNTIEDNKNKLKENQQAILKLHTDLEEMVVSEIELRIENEKEMLDGTVSMQDIILNAVKQRYQDEWDLVKQDIEKKKEALEQEKSLIDERLNARRDAEDEAAKYEELAELKRQLSMVSMDSTRTKDAAALRESIAELEKEIGWDIAEREAENEKTAIQDKIDAYDDYVTKGDEDLEELLSDANNFSEEVNNVLKMSQTDLFEWLKTNVKEYSESLDAAQHQMIESWEATYKQMLGITDTYWTEVNEILSSKDVFLEYMKKSNEYIYASDDERAQLIYQWSEAYDAWQKAQKNDADYEHKDTGLGSTSGSEYTGSSSSSSSGSGSGSGSSVSTKPSTSESVGAIDKFYVKDNRGNKAGPFSSMSRAETVAKQAADLSGYAWVEDSRGNQLTRFTGKGDDDMIDAVSGAAPSAGSGSNSSSGSGLPTIGWPSATPSAGKGWYYKITENGINVAISSKAYSTQKAAQDAAGKILKSGQNFTTRKYKAGGIADFTGLAWLDGSTTDPERILSAEQTRSFDKLVEIMDEFRNAGISMDVLRGMANWSSSVAVPRSLSHIGGAAYQGNSANIGDIFVTITEAQISDDRDIEELANIVGQKFVKEIGKQGFNVSRYNF